MEALATESSSVAASTSIKDEGSPRPESGRGSPPPNCAICLGACQNKSFTDSCLHQFCFSCLLTWSKVKAECPLCKQNFKSIIHNVRSNDQYEEYLVEQRQTEELVERFDFENVSNITTRRFRYRTTVTLPRRESITFQRLLLHSSLINVFPPPAPPPPPSRRPRSPTAFRRVVYRHNLWAHPLPDFTGRFRDCSPEFYGFNDAQIHRLVPWLNRELSYLLNENIHHISYVLARILELLPQYSINSLQFRDAMIRYFGPRTEHFLHELYCFASTPYDMTGYDRSVQYVGDPRNSTPVNEVISSSDSEASSDIVMVSSSEPAPNPPGTSRAPEPVYPPNYISNPSMQSVIPIETISHSDSDDSSSEVVLVGYIKPPEDRTPEVVDLLASDSDVIVQDNSPPGSSSAQVDSQERQATPLVKMSLKLHRTSRVDDTDSDDSLFVLMQNRKKTKRLRSRNSASTIDTHRTTPSPKSDTSYSPCATSSSILTSPDRESTGPQSDEEYLQPKEETSTIEIEEDTRHRQRIRRKGKAKKSKRSSERRSKSTRRTSPSNNDRHKEKKRKKMKSRSGKNVKSSSKQKKAAEVTDRNRDERNECNQPSTSSATHSERVRPDSETKHRTDPDKRRLRSVVKVIRSPKSSSDSSSGKKISSLMNPQPPDDEQSDYCLDVKLPVVERKRKHYSSSDSDDNLPLNLTVKRDLLSK